jgi:hypothetical protein
MCDGVVRTLCDVRHVPDVEIEESNFIGYFKL